MVLFFAGYSISYKVLRRKVGISSEYNCRMVTFVHGVVSCFAALHYVVLPALGSAQGESWIMCGTLQLACVLWNVECGDKRLNKSIYEPSRQSSDSAMSSRLRDGISCSTIVINSKQQIMLLNFNDCLYPFSRTDSIQSHTYAQHGLLHLRSHLVHDEWRNLGHVISSRFDSCRVILLLLQVKQAVLHCVRSWTDRNHQSLPSNALVPEASRHARGNRF